MEADAALCAPIDAVVKGRATAALVAMGIPVSDAIRPLAAQCLRFDGRVLNSSAIKAMDDREAEEWRHFETPGERRAELGSWVRRRLVGQARLAET